MSASIPPNLLTPDPATGHALARLLAAALAANADETDSMAAHLRTSAARRPDPELVTAIYFHAIALANQGWNGATGH